MSAITRQCMQRGVSKKLTLSTMSTATTTCDHPPSTTHTQVLIGDRGVVFPHGEWDVARTLQQVPCLLFFALEPLTSTHPIPSCNLSATHIPCLPQLRSCPRCPSPLPHPDHIFQQQMKMPGSSQGMCHCSCRHQPPLVQRRNSV